MDDKSEFTPSTNTSRVSSVETRTNVTHLIFDKKKRCYYIMGKNFILLFLFLLNNYFDISYSDISLIYLMFIYMYVCILIDNIFIFHYNYFININYY